MKEKTADEMFEELGYEKECREHAELFVNKDRLFFRGIGFNKLTKSIMLSDFEFLCTQNYFELFSEIFNDKGEY